MARFTSNHSEVRHIARINEMMPVYGVVRITLTDGQEFEGAIRSFHVGNNGRAGGGLSAPWQFFGEVTIETLDGGLFAIDYLDIERADDMSGMLMDRYIEAGLYTVID